MRSTAHTPQPLFTSELEVQWGASRRSAMSLSIVAPERARRIPTKVLLDPARLASHGVPGHEQHVPDARRTIEAFQKASQKTSGMTLKG